MSDWSTVLQGVKHHNARCHPDAWPVLRSSLNEALEALMGGEQVRVDLYLLRKR